MNITQQIAFYIWQAREEVGIEGTEQSDWALAEKCLRDCGDYTVTYEDVYSWLMENCDQD